MISKQQIIHLLIHLSIFAIYIDGLIGLNAFLYNSDKLGFLLSIIWVAKLVVILPFIQYGMPRLFASPLFLVLIILLLINTLRAIFNLQSLDHFLPGVFFYLLIFFGGSAGYVWSSLTNRGVIIALSNRTAKLASIIVFLICLIYFMLYIANFIVYFGLGVQIYIITAALLAINDKRFTLLLVLATIMTGKRGLLIVLIAQHSNLLSKLMRRSGHWYSLFFICAILLIGYLSFEFDLLIRFKSTFEISLSDVFNYNDPESSHKLFLATSGRSNEVLGYLDALSMNSMDFWIGLPTDASFNLADQSGNMTRHHYLHISPFNYVKHFGLIIGVYLLFVQTRVVIFAMKYGNRRKDIGLLLYVGYFFAMFFGAIVMIDVLFWVTFSYSYFQFLSFRAAKKYHPNLPL